MTDKFFFFKPLFSFALVLDIIILHASSLHFGNKIQINDIAIIRRHNSVKKLRRVIGEV